MERRALSLFALALAGAALALFFALSGERRSDAQRVAPPEAAAPERGGGRVELERGAAAPAKGSEPDPTARAAPARRAGDAGVAAPAAAPGEVVGRVFTGADEGVRGAEVRVRVELGPLLTAHGPAWTDSEGRFRIPVPGLAALAAAEHPPPPQVWVDARAAGHQGQSVLASHDPRSPERWQVRLRLQAGATLRGRVVGPEGKPVEGAEVNVGFRLEAAMLQGVEATMPGPSSVRTDAEGRYQIGVGRPAAEVFARAAGVGRGSLRLSRGAAAADLELADLVLRPQPVIAGRVTYADGRPAPELAVVAQRDLLASGGIGRDAGRALGESSAQRAAAGGHPFLGAQHGRSGSTHTAPDGSFELVDLEPGSYRLFAELTPAATRRRSVPMRRPLFAPGAPSANAAIETGVSGLVLQLDAHRLKVELAGERTTPPALARVTCESATGAEGRAAEWSHVGLVGESVWLLVTPGIELEVRAWRAGGSERAEQRVRIEQGAYETVVSLRVP